MWDWSTRIIFRFGTFDSIISAFKRSWHFFHSLQSWRSLAYLSHEQVENGERCYNQVSVVSNVSIKDLEVWFIMYLIVIVMATAVDWVVMNHQCHISWIITLFLFGEFKFQVGQKVVFHLWAGHDGYVMGELLFFRVLKLATFCQFLCSQGIL